jgi:hypothetical protein
MYKKTYLVVAGDGDVASSFATVGHYLWWWPYTYFWPFLTFFIRGAASVRPCPVVGSGCLRCDVAAVCSSLSCFPFHIRSLFVKDSLVK